MAKSTDYRERVVVSSGKLTAATGAQTFQALGYSATIQALRVVVPTAMAGSESFTAQFGREGSNTRYGSLEITAAMGAGVFDVPITVANIEATDILRWASDGGASTPRDVALVAVVIPNLP